MGDIRDSVLRIQPYLEALRTIVGMLDIKDRISILDRFKNWDAIEYGPEILVQKMAEEFPSLSERINDLVGVYGATLFLNFIQGKLNSNDVMNVIMAIKKLDETFVDIDRLEIHEFSDPADKELFKSFLVNYDEIRGCFARFSGDFPLPNEMLQMLGAMEDNTSIQDTYYENWLQLKPAVIFTGRKIPNNIRKVYAESRKCFLFGNYLATIVLSRSVLENILKNKYDLKNNWTMGELLQKLLETKQITDSPYYLAKRVKDKADQILHRAAGAIREEAKIAIERTNDLIEMFYGLPDTPKKEPRGKRPSSN